MVEYNKNNSLIEMKLRHWQISITKILKIHISSVFIHAKKL